ncbi:MAG: glycosyltransferase, partial [Pseudomonadota bacterium]|nr:glycosyltransferase [Pseudomonadota bacterium]
PALAQAIADLLNNPDKRDALSVKGRKHISENFTWSRCAEKVVDMYRATIAKNANIQLTTADNST